MRNFQEFFSNDHRAKRVAFVHDTNVYGGVEIYLLQLLRRLDFSLIEPIVVMQGYEGRPYASPPLFVQQVQELGIPVIYSRKSEDDSRVGFLQEIMRLRDFFKSSSIDVVHIHTWQPLGARKATIAAWLAGVPTLIRTEHLPPESNGLAYRLLVKAFDSLTHCICTVSNANLEEQVQRLGRSRKKLFCSHTAVELEKFNPNHNIAEMKRELGLDPNVPVVCQLGRLAPEKGHIFLFKAIPQILREFGPVNFLIVGNGPLETELRQKAKELGIDQYVHLVGFQPEPQRYIQAADIGVLPSTKEGLPLTLLEFMALGKPMVTSSIPLFAEAVVNGETGYMLDVENSTLFAETVLKLLRDSQLRQQFGINATRIVRQHFSMERLVADMISLYDSNAKPLRQLKAVFE